MINDVAYTMEKISLFVEDKEISLDRYIEPNAIPKEIFLLLAPQENVKYRFLRCYFVQDLEHTLNNLLNEYEWDNIGGFKNS